MNRLPRFSFRFGALLFGLSTCVFLVGCGGDSTTDKPNDDDQGNPTPPAISLGTPDTTPGATTTSSEENTPSQTQTSPSIPPDRPASPPPVPGAWRWKFAKGEKIHYTITEEAKIQQGPVNLKLNTTTYSTWSIGEVASNSAQVTRAADRLLFKGEAPLLGAPIEYDSEVGEEPQSVLWMQMGGFYKAITKEPITYKIDQRGNLSDYRLSPSINKAMMEAAAKGIDGNTTGSLRTSEQAWIITLPQQIVREGDTWTREDEFEQSGTKITKKTTFSYQGEVTQDAKTLQKISIQSAYSIAQTEKPSPLSIKSIEESGKALFDAQSGKLYRASLVTKLVGEASAQGQTLPVTSEMKLTAQLGPPKE